MKLLKQRLSYGGLIAINSSQLPQTKTSTTVAPGCRIGHWYKVVSKKESFLKLLTRVTMKFEMLFIRRDTVWHIFLSQTN